MFNLDDACRIAGEAELMMTGREYTVVVDHVLRLAGGSGCSAYDCEFVGLAQDLGVPLVTADRRVLRAFPSDTVALDVFAV